MSGWSGFAGSGSLLLPHLQIDHVHLQFTQIPRQQVSANSSLNIQASGREAARGQWDTYGGRVAEHQLDMLSSNASNTPTL